MSKSISDATSAQEIKVAYSVTTNLGATEWEIGTGVLTGEVYETWLAGEEGRSHVAGAPIAAEEHPLGSKSGHNMLKVGLQRAKTPRRPTLGRHAGELHVVQLG